MYNISMTNVSIPEASYSNLLKHIKKEIAEGLANAQKAYDKEKVIAYWKIGQSISKHLSKNKDRADYGKKLYKRLSGDLGIGERLLYQMSQFYNTYPNLKPTHNLKWSHYRLLTSVKDQEKRNLFESKVSDDNWSKRALENFIKEDKEQDVKPEKPHVKKKGKLSISKGRLYAYKIFKDEYADNMLIDCGFNTYKESEVANFSSEFVETVKTESDYKFIKSTANRKQLYTYKAYIKKIIDGDTMWVNIDCGFKIWAKQKIRLRGIDTPGIETKKGIESFKFVCKALKNLPFIIIKSHGRDKYDRYLSDIFYLKGEEGPLVVLEKGAFLNQVLLDENLAARA
ncbi:MAG: hypothetical protein KAS13_02955 [Candidatus Omnitrophica bacterium]|nr:hypothetical protein [Candidatus Omnitrophota bacterium]